MSGKKSTSVQSVSAASETPSVIDMMMRKERKAGTAHVHRLTDYIAF
ncbi:MAG: hypothetical protein ACJAUE_001382 [Alcanivorax sp.]|jgi:hypothetical protein